MPDASLIIVAVDEDYMLLRNWYFDNPETDTHPEPQYPVDITYELEGGDSTATINSAEEMQDALEECRGFNWDRPPGGGDPIRP